MMCSDCNAHSGTHQKAPTKLLKGPRSADVLFRLVNIRRHSTRRLPTTPLCSVCLSCMLQVIGSPTEADLGFVTSDKARRYLRTLPKMPRSDWRQRYPQVRGVFSEHCSHGLSYKSEEAVRGNDAPQWCDVAVLSITVGSVSADVALLTMLVGCKHEGGSLLLKTAAHYPRST